MNSLGEAYDCDVIGLDQLMIGVVWGALLIAIGLIPRLFQGLVEGVHNYVSLSSSEFRGRSQPVDTVDQPTWLAGLGAVIVALTVVAYFLD